MYPPERVSKVFRLSANTDFLTSFVTQAPRSALGLRPHCRDGARRRDRRHDPRRRRCRSTGNRHHRRRWRRVNFKRPAFGGGRERRRSRAAAAAAALRREGSREDCGGRREASQPVTCFGTTPSIRFQMTRPIYECVASVCPVQSDEFSAADSVADSRGQSERSVLYIRRTFGQSVRSVSRTPISCWNGSTVQSHSKRPVY